MTMRKIAPSLTHKKTFNSSFTWLARSSIFQFKNKAVKLNSPRESFFTLLTKLTSKIHFFHLILSSMLNDIFWLTLWCSHQFIIQSFLWITREEIWFQSRMYIFLGTFDGGFYWINTMKLFFYISHRLILLHRFFVPFGRDSYCCHPWKSRSVSPANMTGSNNFLNGMHKTFLFIHLKSLNSVSHTI